MSSPLFLEKTEKDTYQVVTIRDEIIGEGRMPDTAIKSARAKGHKEDIFFGSGYATLETDDLFSEAELIAELSQLAGMKILDAYDDDMRPIGYRMELRE